jgi:L-iditol 2-dehydrogenase
VTVVRAASLRAARELVLAEVELPEPRDGDVVVDVEACGICATNVHGWRDPSTAVGPVTLPGAHGHELAGCVRETRERVCLDPALACACGDCDRCVAGDPVGCRTPTPLAVWGFADAVVAPRRGLVAVPDGLELEPATLAEPLASAVHALRTSWSARIDGRLDGVPAVVLGAGTLGLLALARLRQLGAGPVAVVARHPHQAEVAADLGADEVLPDDQPQLVRELRRRRAALVVEAVGGAAETVATAFAAVDRGGEVVVLGLFDAARGLDVTDAVLRGVRARFAAAAGVADGTSDVARALELLAAEPRLARLLTHRFPLAEVDAAFATAAAPEARALRVLVRPS